MMRLLRLLRGWRENCLWLLGLPFLILSGKKVKELERMCGNEVVLSRFVLGGVTLAELNLDPLSSGNDGRSGVACFWEVTLH